jgi:hypothetical protein
VLKSCAICVYDEPRTPKRKLAFEISVLPFTGRALRRKKHREVDSIFTKRPRTGLILGAALIVMLVLTLAPATFAQTLEQQRTDAKTNVDQLQQKM